MLQQVCGWRDNAGSMNAVAAKQHETESKHGPRYDDVHQQSSAPRRPRHCCREKEEQCQDTDLIGWELSTEAFGFSEMSALLRVLYTTRSANNLYCYLVHHFLSPMPFSKRCYLPVWIHLDRNGDWEKLDSWKDIVYYVYFKNDQDDTQPTGLRTESLQVSSKFVSTGYITI